ncbi:MAG TPA: methyltransferase domain-containing protein, partial [Methyloceanibacter sp.]
MASEARKLNPDGYVHTRDAEEYRRLRDQAAMWQSATEKVLDAVGLSAGMSALDVGSGPGVVMRSMASRVGPEGSITGIEIDAKLGAQALADLRAEGGAKFTQIDADMQQLDMVKGGPFDLVYCRLFLMHMQDPVAAL